MITWLLGCKGLKVLSGISRLQKSWTNYSKRSIISAYSSLIFQKWILSSKSMTRIVTLHVSTSMYASDATRSVLLHYCESLAQLLSQMSLSIQASSSSVYQTSLQATCLTNMCRVKSSKGQKYLCGQDFFVCCLFVSSVRWPPGKMLIWGYRI